MNHLGKPDAGDLPVRFEEGDGDGMGRAIFTLLLDLRIFVSDVACISSGTGRA